MVETPASTIFGNDSSWFRNEPADELIPHGAGGLNRVASLGSAAFRNPVPIVKNKTGPVTNRIRN